jgi:hypothetical protein
MSDYDTDFYTWTEQQAGLLRRRAAGELVNEAELDWSNLAEEIAHRPMVSRGDARWLLQKHSELRRSRPHSCHRVPFAVSFSRGRHLDRKGPSTAWRMARRRARRRAAHGELQDRQRISGWPRKALRHRPRRTAAVDAADVRRLLNDIG